MGQIQDAARAAYAAGPSSSPREPSKFEIINLFSLLESTLGTALNGLVLGNAVVYATRASLYADLARPANTLGVVYNDSTAAYNGVYVKSGASGSGSWTITGLALPADGPALAAIISEVTAARGGQASLNARLNGIDATVADAAERLDTVEVDLADLIEKFAHLGGLAVADTYLEAVTVTTTPAVIAEADTPVITFSAFHGGETGLLRIGFGGADPLGPGAEAIAPGKQLEYSHGVPPGPIRAVSTDGDIPVSLKLGNNSAISPNAPARATTLIRAFDSARTSSTTPIAWEKAIRKCYYELDRLRIIQDATLLAIFNSDAAVPARMDWTNPGQIYDLIGSPTFVAKTGYTLNGVDQALRATGRRANIKSGMAPTRVAIALSAAYGGSTQSGKQGLSDGQISVNPYHSAPSWSFRAMAVSGDIVPGFDISAPHWGYAERTDGNSMSVMADGGDPQRVYRDNRVSFLNTDFIFGANNTSSNVIEANSYWKGTLRWAYAGLPLGANRARKMAAAIETFFAETASL